MPTWLRKTLFWIFVLAFACIAPLLVFYTAGYRYHFSTGQVTRTGVLSITTQPKQTNIFIDGIDIEKQTPEILKRIMPADYDISLQAEGYHPWYGKITIKSGKTIQLQSIRLFANTTPDPLFDKTIASIATNPSNDCLAYLIQEAGWQEIWLYCPENNTHSLINQSIQNEQSHLLSWSAQGSTLLTFSPTEQSIQLYSLEGEAIYLPALPKTISAAKWHPSTDHLLLLTIDNTIIQLDTQTQATESFDTQSHTFALDASLLRLIQAESHTEIAQYIDEKKETLALLPKGNYTIEKRDTTLLLLTDTLGQLFLISLHDQEPILTQVNADYFDWHENTNQLVYTDGFELSVYNANTHTTELITRQSSAITSVYWHPDGTHIFVFDGGLHVFEAYPQAQQRSMTTLIHEVDIQTLWTNKQADSVYFYGTYDTNKGFYKLDLVVD